MSLDIIADLLKGSQDDAAVACDMLEELDLDLVAAGIRSSSIEKVWSKWISRRTELLVMGNDRKDWIARASQWNNYLASIQTEGS